MTKPTVSKHWRKLVGRRDQAWIPPEPLNYDTVIIIVWLVMYCLSLHVSRTTVESCWHWFKPHLSLRPLLSCHTIYRNWKNCQQLTGETNDLRVAVWGCVWQWRCSPTLPRIGVKGTAPENFRNWTLQSVHFNVFWASAKYSHSSSQDKQGFKTPETSRGLLLITGQKCTEIHRFQG